MLLKFCLFFSVTKNKPIQSYEATQCSKVWSSYGLYSWLKAFRWIVLGMTILVIWSLVDIFSFLIISNQTISLLLMDIIMNSTSYVVPLWSFGKTLYLFLSGKFVIISKCFIYEWKFHAFKKKHYVISTIQTHIIENIIFLCSIIIESEKVK